MRSWELLVALSIAACGGGNNTPSPDACSGSACSVCAANETDCSGTCSDTTSDPMNCGGCGMACNAGDVCVDSQCQVPCDPGMLMSSKTDTYGTTWDGLERGPAALDAAKADCLTFGARLPTATEIFRNASTQAGGIGESFNTNPLWSLAPDDKLDQATLKLSDGSATSTPAATATHYRCVCPAAAPKSFTGKNCNGVAGAECFALGKYNLDTKDRPALRKGAQAFECAFARGHLAESQQVLEAVANSLPAGAAIATADHANYTNSVGLKWTTSAWTPTGNLSLLDIRTASPFRCAGLAAEQAPNPNTVANQFVGPTSLYKSETADTAAATWTAAHDTCFVRGGHLPRAAELAELVQQGLPNGSNQQLWTSDEDGYDSTGGAQFLSEVLNWNAVDQRFSYFYGGTDATATWAFKTTSHAYRCIYYPIDASYTAPTTCHGGCFMASLGGSPAATLWFDSTDRAAANLFDATKDCADEGGHLASERDYTEAIRAGLPNGSNANVLTSDFGFGNAPTLNAEVVKWTGTQTTFTDVYPAAMTWSPPATALGYRCMWTNELR